MSFILIPLPLANVSPGKKYKQHQYNINIGICKVSSYPIYDDNDLKYPSMMYRVLGAMNFNFPVFTVAIVCFEIQ